jgi:hypothetical protein
MGGPLSTGRTDCGVYGLVETSTIPQPDSNMITNGRNAFTVACCPLAVALMRGSRNGDGHRRLLRRFASVRILQARRAAVCGNGSR